MCVICCLSACPIPTTVFFTLFGAYSDTLRPNFLWACANVDKIIEGNTSIETIDSGTNGKIEFKVDNVMKLEIDNGGNTIPGADNASNLGSSTKRWANIYAADMHYSNEGDKNSVDGTWGSYTIQEGENDLFLLNNRNGKKYKFNLTEVN